jgi:hypothetical protein
MFNNVLIAQIRPQVLYRDAVRLPVIQNHILRYIDLPAWIATDRAWFIAAKDVRSYLDVQSDYVHTLEWFAVENIPGDMITIIQRS